MEESAQWKSAKHPSHAVGRGPGIVREDQWRDNAAEKQDDGGRLRIASGANRVAEAEERGSRDGEKDHGLENDAAGKAVESSEQ